MMKPAIFLVTLFCIACSGKHSNHSGDKFVMDSSWKQKKISPVLTISLPDSSRHDTDRILHAYYGQGKYGIYGVDYFDTVVVEIKNRDDFRNALKGYLYGKFTDPKLLPYDFTITDTSIGNSNGCFLTGFTKDSLICSHAFCYLTSAAGNMYYFYCCQQAPGMNDETKQFYHSIQFTKEGFKEYGYELEPVVIHKAAKK